MKSTSKCKACGEKLLDTGNFFIKIIKAKRKPRKAEKLMKSKGAKLDEITTNYGQTKFGRFLLKRADSANFMEISCGNCSSSTRISMKKPSDNTNNNNSLDNQFRSSFETPSARLDSFDGLSKKQRKKKKKDLNAGLVIPLSLQSPVSSSTTVSSDIYKKEVPVNKQYSIQMVQTPNSSNNRNFQQMTYTKSNNQAKKTAVSEEKQMEHLKKMFAKSKQSPQSKGGSLKDLLASM